MCLVYYIFGDWDNFFKKISSSLFCIYGYLSTCKKSKKSDERLLRKMRYRRTDGQRDRPIDKPYFIGLLSAKPGPIKAQVI